MAESQIDKKPHVGQKPLGGHKAPGWSETPGWREASGLTKPHIWQMTLIGQKPLVGNNSILVKVPWRPKAPGWKALHWTDASHSAETLGWIEAHG